jgi:hypothetical protein
MHSDTWYDLAVRELAEMTDPAKEKLADLEETVEELAHCCASADAEEDGAPAEPATGDAARADDTAARPERRAA